ncbi:MAG TPA: transglycosylase family protein [Gaiellaceae bacterium]|nr:transglycosylase family protein [Gaiellaceae bacterium]
MPQEAEATDNVVAAVKQLVLQQQHDQQQQARNQKQQARHLQVVQQRVYDAQMRQTLAGIHDARDRAWQWEDVMSAHRQPYGSAADTTVSLGYRKSVLALWKARAKSAQYQAQHPPRMKDWLCIHHYEGAWPDNTGNGYYGGLQMDMTFMATYGAGLLRRKGTADHWTPLEQIWVAERAYESGRGFYPWPNTARFCGLI